LLNSYREWGVMDESITIVLDSSELLSGICGANDGNLRLIEVSLGGRIVARGNEIRFEPQLKELDNSGEDSQRRFKLMIDNLTAVLRDGEIPTPEYVQALASSLCAGETPENAGELSEQAANLLKDAVIQIPQGFHRVYPRSKNQADYIRGMRACEIAFSIGPAGTGKTYLAIAEALRLVLSKKMRKLVLTRPVVEAGENLGFLPGDLAQKINPYLRPLYDAMESLASFDVIHRMEETRVIEIAPLAYMRGRSLNDSVVILDEAQNTTREQMKMFLTRIGTGSRAIITGDVTQIDLPRSSDSGLIHAAEILKNVEGIHFSFLHTVDVVRNPLIKKIIQAYNEGVE